MSTLSVSACPPVEACTNRDTQTSAKVAVINEAAVRKYFPHENPIGQRFGQFFEVSGDIEIVGIVRDANYNSLRDEAPPTMYVPYLQQRLAAMTLSGDGLSFFSDASQRW